MVFDSATRTFSRKIHESPKLETGQVAVRVTCCTICGSDLHTYQGRRNCPQNCVLGHEVIGRIEQWGGIKPPKDYFGNPVHSGQRITWVMAVGCGECFFCRHDLPQKCENLFKYGHESDHGKGSTGGLSEYCYLVPGTPIFPIPQSLKDSVAAPANCATATVSAALRLVSETHDLKDANVLVVGLGMLGLTATAQLADGGAKSIIALDTERSRLRLSRQFGSTHEFDSGMEKQELADSIRTITGGRGADIALDFAGVTSAVQSAIENIRTGGCVLLAGSVFPTGEISLDPETVVRKMLTIRGLHNYQPRDLEIALEFLNRTSDRFPFADLVSRSFSLEDVEDAFEFAADNRPIRVAIVD